MYISFAFPQNLRPYLTFTSMLRKFSLFLCFPLFRVETCNTRDIEYHFEHLFHRSMYFGSFDRSNVKVFSIIKKKTAFRKYFGSISGQECAF